MASIGLSKIYWKVPDNSDCGVIGKAIHAELTLDNTEPETLRADDVDAESLTVFSGATLTLQVDELTIPTAKSILGLWAAPSTSGKIVFAADAQAPRLTLAMLVKKMIGGSIKWRCICFPRVQFQIPDYSIDTQGETVNFQTPELTAKVYKDDNGEWQEWCDFDTLLGATGFIVERTSIVVEEEGGDEYIPVETAGGG